jgi:hypothetical protein
MKILNAFLLHNSKALFSIKVDGFSARVPVRAVEIHDYLKCAIKLETPIQKCVIYAVLGIKEI